MGHLALAAMVLMTESRQRPGRRVGGGGVCTRFISHRDGISPSRRFDLGGYPALRPTDSELNRPAWLALITRNESPRQVRFWHEADVLCRLAQRPLMTPSGHRQNEVSASSRPG